MIFPLWFFFGLGSAFISAGMMLTQERLRVSGFAAAFWGKASCALLMIPFMLILGFPQDPLFYMYLGVTSVLYAISDVFFYESIKKTNAGAVARMLPCSVIFNFLLWFAVDPALLQKYLNAPIIAASIFLVLCMWAGFAMRLKKCPHARRTIGAVWFVMVAATIGPLFTKAVTLHANVGQGPYAYVFCQALMMMAIWAVYLSWRKPASLMTRAAWQGGMAVGVFNAGATLLATIAYYYVDNPAYVTALRFLDSVIILGVYAMLRRKMEGDIAAGLGVVACAAALVILKTGIH